MKVEGLEYSTYGLRPETVADLEDYICNYHRVTGEKQTKQQFIETAILRELARVRGEDPMKVEPVPNHRKLAAERRRKKRDG